MDSGEGSERAFRFPFLPFCECVSGAETLNHVPRRAIEHRHARVSNAVRSCFRAQLPVCHSVDRQGKPVWIHTESPRALLGCD